jgi:hypothetical protein
MGACTETESGATTSIIRSEPSHPTTQLRISAIRAFFYYEEQGRFDDRDLLSGELVLRNVIVGEGDAEAPTNTTLVLVDVTGPGFSTETVGVLQAQARAGTRELLKQSVPLRFFFSEKQQISIPFLVHDAACEPLEITASLEVPGKGVTSSLSGTIPFGCGE